MTTKLTLSIEDKVIESAKQYARKNGKSLSKLVETYLRYVSNQEKDKDEIDPRVRKLMGIIKLDDDFDYKKELSDAINAKYRS